MSVWPGIWAWGKGSGAVTRRGTRPLIIRTYDVTLSESEESPPFRRKIGSIWRFFARSSLRMTLLS